MFDQIKLSAWQSGLRGKLPQLSLPLRVELWNGERIDLSPDPPRVTIRIPGPAALRYLRSPSLYSLGRAYVEGAIEVMGRAADIIAVGNALAASGAAGGSTVDTRRGRLADALGWRRNHTRESDRDAIRYHYDVSNEFYAAWLDPGMVYSCAYFEGGDEDLATAQVKKIDHILRKIDLRPGQTLLDIGCGWGALVLRAAEKFGARCVGITLSENQAALARERVIKAGLQDRVEIRIQDYRDVDGHFERITSVGMFEHVGVQHLKDYFARVAGLLAPGGVAMNHGITTTDADNGATPYGGGQFIDEYVFPQGELAHLGTVVRAMQEGGLEVRDVENLRRHYAHTCALWTDNFENNAAHIRTLTDPKRFRIWHVYLAGCAYAFAHDRISLYQIVCGKAGSDVGQLPWSRKYMYT
ncbi:class I SAM-dependent methyltransferase [Massilia oculi]|uniref:class I SAM-dependent methyltransferase n=1 Tax=Massilia oculi TaxID=945844 RepID=UPI001AAFD4D2